MRRGGAEAPNHAHATPLSQEAPESVGGEGGSAALSHISTRPRQRPVPTVHGQADGPGANRPHRAAVGPGVQGVAAPQLEKAPCAEGLEPEPRAGDERAPVLEAGAAEGWSEFGRGPWEAAVPSVDAKRF